MNRYDSTSSLIWLLAALGITLWSSVTLRIGTLSHPGPGFLPLLCGITMVVLAIVVFYQAKTKEKGIEGESFWTRESLIRISLTVVTLLIYGICLEYLGFNLTTFIVMLLIFTEVAGTPWFIGIVESLIATGACYLIFGYFMKIQLPKGWLGF
jgi:putative tricarboxylic transport membrane protein